MTGGAYSRIRSFLYLLFFRSSHFFEFEKFDSFSKRFFESSIWARSWLYRRHKFQISKCSGNATEEMTPFRGHLFSQQFFHSCLTCPRGCSGQGATVVRHPSVQPDGMHRRQEDRSISLEAGLQIRQDWSILRAGG